MLKSEDKNYNKYTDYRRTKERNIEIEKNNSEIAQRKAEGCKNSQELNKGKIYCRYTDLTQGTVLCDMKVMQLVKDLRTKSRKIGLSVYENK